MLNSDFISNLLDETNNSVSSLSELDDTDKDEKYYPPDDSSDSNVQVGK